MPTLTGRVLGLRADRASISMPPHKVAPRISYLEAGQPVT